MSWLKRKRKDDADPVAWTGQPADPEPGEAPRGGAGSGPAAGDDDPPGEPGSGSAAEAHATAGSGGFEPEAGDAEPSATAAPADRSAGPFDVSEVSGPEGYLDLGGIWLPARDGMELRLEVEEATSRVTAATVHLGASAVQLQAFAAPRTAGIWDEIRAEIAGSVTRQGGTADDVPGPFGQELLARIPVRAADGRTSHQPARFAGIDGPRWFLRAVFHGAAAYEPSEAGELEGFVREVVVVRGADAMAPRELLALRLPENAGSAEGEGGEPGESPGSGADEREPLEPFRRGPEITEVR